jgi:leucyl-tRNA synthetase
MSAAECSSAPAASILRERVRVAPLDGERIDLTGARQLVVADVRARAARALGRDVEFSIGAWGADIASVTELLDLTAAREGERAASGDVGDGVVRLFEQLLGKNLLYATQAEGAGQWFLRTAQHEVVLHDRQESLRHWHPAAIANQQRVHRSVTGTETTARTLHGGALSVFADASLSPADALYVAISPNHQDIESWRGELNPRAVPASQGGDTGAAVIVPGNDRLLPVLISARVDERFGPSAVVGTAESGLVHPRVAATIAGRHALRLNVKTPEDTWRPAVRYPSEDLVISLRGERGTRVPFYRCAACGEYGGGEGAPLGCPRCDDAVEGESGVVLTDEFRFAWRELQRRLDEDREDGQIGRSVYVYASRSSGCLRLQRLLNVMLEDDEDRVAWEPHWQAVLCGDVGCERGAGSTSAPLDELSARYGSDALRFALLHLSAPQRDVAWDRPTITFAHRWLAGLRAYGSSVLDTAADVPARPLGEIDRDPLRRRLQRWREIALARATESLTLLQTHLLTRNAIRLVGSIRDFETRAAARPTGTTAADRLAARTAMLTAVRLLAPAAPRLTEELLNATRPGRFERPTSRSGGERSIH